MRCLPCPPPLPFLAPPTTGSNLSLRQAAGNAGIRATPPAPATTPPPPRSLGTFSRGAGGRALADWTSLRVVVETCREPKEGSCWVEATTCLPGHHYPPGPSTTPTHGSAAPDAPHCLPAYSRLLPVPPLPSHRTHSHLSFNPKMARLFVTVASFVAACATVNAFQVPRMSLDKYRSELAETAKKIASPGTFPGRVDGGEGGVEGGRGWWERSGL